MDNVGVNYRKALSNRGLRSLTERGQVRFVCGRGVESRGLVHSSPERLQRALGARGKLRGSPRRGGARARDLRGFSHGFTAPFHAPSTAQRRARRGRTSFPCAPLEAPHGRTVFYAISWAGETRETAWNAQKQALLSAPSPGPQRAQRGRSPRRSRSLERVSTVAWSRSSKPEILVTA